MTEVGQISLTGSDCEHCALCEVLSDTEIRCSRNGVVPPSLGCAAQELTEDGWLNAGFAIMSNGDKIKLP